MKISAIVTTYDSKRFSDASDAVYSLLNQDYADKEIIVVVDRNEQLYKKMLATLPNTVKVILSKAGGLSNSRNEGAKHATGEIIAFMDDDAFAEKTWMANIVRNYADPAVIGVGGCIKPMWYQKDDGFPEEIFWIIGCTYKGCPTKKSTVRNTFGGNLSFRRAVFLDCAFCADVGRTGSVQLTADETEFSIGVLKLFPNSKIIFDPEAIVYHRIYPYRLSLRFIIKRAYGEGISKAYVATKYKQDSLSTENQYLKNLIVDSFPTEMRNILFEKHKTQTIKKIMLNLIVTFLVLGGYVRGKMKWGL